MEKAISLPFSISPYGSVTYTTDQKKIYGDRVRSVIGTTIGERVMRPTFGGEIAFSVFENMEQAVETIKRNVKEAFNSQLQLLSLTDVNTSYDEYSGVIKVDVTYSLPNQETIVTTTVGVVYLRGSTQAIKENL